MTEIQEEAAAAVLGALEIMERLQRRVDGHLVIRQNHVPAGTALQQMRYHRETAAESSPAAQRDGPPDRHGRRPL
jgi:hypothetical protein